MKDGSEPGVVQSPDGHVCVIAQPQLTGLLLQLTEKGSSLRLQAAGRSMNPFIREGDFLTLSPPAAGDPKLGDIVAFKHPVHDKLVVHRIIKTTADSCLVRGDCCFEPDGIISRKDILGLVRRIDRRGRRIKIGLGPGKCLIAFLSAKNILWRLENLLLRSCFSGPVIRRCLR